MNQINQPQNIHAIIPSSTSQAKLNFTHQQPNQLSRKFFHANLSLSSAASFQRDQKLKNQPSLSTLSHRQDQICKKNVKVNLEKSSKDSKRSTQTVKKLERFRIGSKLNSKEPLAESMKLHTKQHKNLGEWIKPKNFQSQLTAQKYQKQLQNKSFANNQSQHQFFGIVYIQSVSQTKIDKTQDERQFSEQIIPGVKDNKNNTENFIDKDEDFIKLDHFIETQQQATPQLKYSLSNKDIKSSSKPTVSFGEINFHEEINELKKDLSSCQTHKKNQNLKRAQSLKSIDSIMSHSYPFAPIKKPHQNSNLNSSRQRKETSKKKIYQKFKHQVLEYEQKRKQQKKNNLTSDIQLLEDTKKSISTLMSSPTKIKQSHITTPQQSSQVLPSHFSFTSENSYVKKYLQLTSSPNIFSQSLRQLRYIYEDEQHQYFKYQKYLKKHMYHANRKDSTENLSRRKQKSTQRQNDDQKTRKVSYNKFIDKIKTKPKQTQVHFHSPEIQQQQDTQFILPKIPQPIIEVKNESSLLSNKIQISSNDSGYDSSQRAKKYEDRNQISKQISDRNVNFSHQILNFRKNNQRVKKIKDKIQRIKTIENQLCLENRRIDLEFTERRLSQLKKFNIQAI